MKFSRIFLNRLHDKALPRDTVVVIDVLRSFTTAAVALARGAAAIYPVEGGAAALALAGRLADPVSVGALGGGDPMPGFDFGNSPSRLMTAELRGKRVVLSTAAGVRGLQRFRRARRLYATGLVNAAATVRAIQRDRAREVCFVITGEWVDRNGDEDIACADYLQALLSGDAAGSAEYSTRVTESDFGRRFTAGTWPNLPPADLELAARADLFDFAMRVEVEGEHLVIHSGPHEPAAQPALAAGLGTLA